MKKLLTALLIVAGIAQAEITTNLGATSDYRYRGISQTQNAPAIQGGIDYTNKNGFYAGNWNSSVSSLVIFAWRNLLYWSCVSSNNVCALRVALSIEINRAACSASSDSNNK